MPLRIDDHQAPPGAAKVMWNLRHYVNACGLEPALRELVKLSAARINGCAFCIDRHAKDARAMGESDQRLYTLRAWPEAPFCFRTCMLDRVHT
jgi:AhpD family alkylhydroperoxidase